MNQLEKISKSLPASRFWLALVVVSFSIAGIIWVSHEVLEPLKGKKEQIENAKWIFASLLPMFGTWVGVVLAFYFGRENFEAASNRYERVIDRLTPDILDEVPIRQVMIPNKTMVSLNWEKAEKMTVSEAVKFLKRVDKSRLPVFDGNKQIKAIIHLSTLAKYTLNSEGESDDERTKKTLSDFVATVSEEILYIDETSKLEDARHMLTKSENSKDIFVKNNSGQIVGWLTDTLILRFTNSDNL